MCQPGLPAPQGLSQLGSPGLELFHRAKSLSDLFSVGAALRSPSPGDKSVINKLRQKIHLFCIVQHLSS